MMFNVLNFIACVFFARSIIRASYEYGFDRNFIFWARIFFFSFMSACVLDLFLGSPGVYVFAGAITSFVAAWVLSTAKNVSTMQVVATLAGSMFFWPYFISYCVVSMAYYDKIVDKINKENSRDDGYF